MLNPASTGVPAGERDASPSLGLPPPLRDQRLRPGDVLAVRSSPPVSVPVRRVASVETLDSSPGQPVGERYSTDEAEEPSHSSSSPKPVGERYSSESSFDRTTRRRAPGLEDSCSAIPVDTAWSPPRLVEEATSGTSSSSEIGPVGEVGDPQEEESELSVPFGESTHDVGATSPFSTAVSRRTTAHSLPSEQPTFSTLNEQSPTPLSNPALSPPSTQPATSPGETDNRREMHMDTIEWFEKEISSLRRSASIMSRTPESRLASRTEYWEIYNRILGARGPYYHRIWIDFTNDT
ncbi:hypothetical protein C8Q76DRAFT_800932 [Earliella scabrosa]|nr:hypothetical protein C8Q76DRAFT_800932 [Earliella scabrosa]